MTGLPPLLVLTDRRSAARPLPDVVAAAVQGGARAVLLREKDLPAGPRSELADLVRDRLEPVGGLLLVAAPWEGPLPGPGVHLPAAAPVPEPRPQLLGRSCHDAAELDRAAREDCDYVTVSPLHPTASKPGYGPPLGIEGLAALTGRPGAPPAYALGGVSVVDVAGCRAAGAAGVAVMGAVMRADRPDRCVARLLAALAAA